MFVLKFEEGVPTCSSFGDGNGIVSDDLQYLGFRSSSIHLCSFQNVSRGQDLLDAVYKHLNLLETAYFGLRYVDSSGQTVSQQGS